METDSGLYRKLVRSTIAEYERARANCDVELILAMRELTRAAYEVETCFEKQEIAATTAMLAIVTPDEDVARKLYLLALEQNRRKPDEESYVWRLYLGRRFREDGLISLQDEFGECRTSAARLGDEDAVREANAMLANLPV